MPTPIEKVYSIRLAVQGENATTPIEIDMTTWAEEFPNANFYVLFKPYNEQNIVPVITEYDAPILKWIPTSSITAIVGVGFAEVRAVDASTGLVKKSRIIPTSIENSVSGNEGIEPPDAYSDWVNSVLASKDAAVSAKAAAIAAAETAEEAASTAVAQTGLIDEVILVQDDEPTAEHNKLYIKRTQPEAVEIATEAELTELRTEMQGDLAEIQTDVQGVENDVATLQTDVQGINEDLLEVQQQASEGVKFTSQTLTDAQQAQTRANIGAADQGEVAELKSAIEELEAGSLSALGATAGQVPVADGNGSWAWGDAAGGTMILGPEEIQKLVADGKAKSTFNIGDVIYIPWTNYTPSTPVVYQFPFVVVHIGDVYDQNDVLHHDALWLMAMYAEPEEIVFDAAEDTVVNLSTEPNALEGWYYWGLTGTDYTALNLSAGDAIPTTYDSVHKCAINNLSVLRYGYNRWRDSAYRQWLNSDAAKNANWWTSQHEGDVAPTATYTNKPGWLYGFENRWLDVIKPVRVQTATNTVTDGDVTDVTYDRFFLPSLEQMYGKPQAAGVEGDYWEYWKEETGLDAPSNGSSSDSNEARKIPSVVNYPRGSAVYCRLRSALRGYGYAVWYVSTGGYLNTNGTAGSASRALPACVIY